MMMTSSSLLFYYVLVVCYYFLSVVVVVVVVVVWRIRPVVVSIVYVCEETRNQQKRFARQKLRECRDKKKSFRHVELYEHLDPIHLMILNFWSLFEIDTPTPTTSHANQPHTTNHPTVHLLDQDKREDDDTKTKKKNRGSTPSLFFGNFGSNYFVLLYYYHY